jgi:hypothetical protein
MSYAETLCIRSLFEVLYGMTPHKCLCTDYTSTSLYPTEKSITIRSDEYALLYLFRWRLPVASRSDVLFFALSKFNASSFSKISSSDKSLFQP